jgi:hypothetical protein
MIPTARAIADRWEPGKLRFPKVRLNRFGFALLRAHRILP